MCVTFDTSDIYCILTYLVIFISAMRRWVAESVAFSRQEAIVISRLSMTQQSYCAVCRLS